MEKAKQSELFQVIYKSLVLCKPVAGLLYVIDASHVDKRKVNNFGL